MVAPKLSANMREQVRAGDDVPRQIRSLEAAAKEAIAHIQEWVNRYLPTTRGGFSPYQTNHIVASGNLPAESCVVNHVDSNIAAIDVLLPPPVRDLVVIVKDWGANATANNITIRRSHPDQLIDQAANDATITTDNGVMWLIADGRDWQTF